MIIIKKKKNFLKILKKKCLIYFFANWCFSCLEVKKNIYKIEKKTNIIFLSLNIDYFNEIITFLNIRNIPCILINNKIKNFLVGNINFKKLVLKIFLTI